MNNKDAFIATLFHALELFIVLAFSFLILRLFNVNGDGTEVIMSVVIGGFVKFIRANGNIPVDDYVNNRKQ